MQKTYKVNINKMEKFIKNTMAVVGGLLLYCSLSTIDFYAMQLRTNEPESAWTTLVVGAMLVAPAIIVELIKFARERRKCSERMTR